MGRSTAPTNDVRLAELLAALSLATDLGNGFAPETALRRGENIPIAVCVVTLTHTLATQMQRGQPIDAKALVARRAGTDYSPDVAAAFTRRADDLLEPISAESVWAPGP